MLEAANQDRPLSRVHHYPEQHEIREYLRLIPGHKRKLVQSVRSILFAHAGTPQANQDWTDPDTWIPALLAGEERVLAQYLWDKSNHVLNPRFLSNVWHFTLINHLVGVDGHDILRLTEDGEDFLANEYGAVVQKIDYVEGLLRLLEIVSEKGTGKRSDYLPEFELFLLQNSEARAPATIATRWYGRMQNLVGRGLIDRSGLNYQISSNGLRYLETVQYRQVSPDVPAQPEPLTDLRRLLKANEDGVRRQMHQLLQAMDPYRFEELIKQLLEAMGYEGVEVTSKSNDGGVDVKARIQVGITTVAEVVQAKRHAGTISRPVLDQLRGSLHRFDAMRGTIVTTGKFSNGTKEAAFEKGAAPITLIDGDKLIDLLVEHEIGVRKETISLMKLEPADFVGSDEGPEA